MSGRALIVRVVGDSRHMQRELEKASKAAQKFSQSSTGANLTKQAKATRELVQAEESLVRVRSKRAIGVGPFRLAGIGLGAGTALVAATQSVRALGDALETTGAAAFTTQGRLKNLGSSLIRGDLVGAVQAISRIPKTLEEAGIDPAKVGQEQFRALQQVATGTTDALNKLGTGGRFATDELRKLEAITKLAGTANKELAAEALKAVYALDKLGGLTAKGVFEERAAGGGMLPPTAFERGPGRPTLNPLSPSDRREIALLGQEGAARLPGLRDRLRQLRNQLDFQRNYKKRKETWENIARTQAEIIAIQADMAAKAKEAARTRLETQLGWLELAVDRAGLTKTINDDLKRMRAVEAWWRERIRHEGNTLRNAQGLFGIQKRIRDLLKKDPADRDPLAGLMQVSTKRLTSILAAGTGLGVAGRRVLGANISAQQLRPIYMSVQLDGREVSKSVSQNQTRTGKRTGNQTSGRRG